MKIALAQINQTVGDFKGNLERIDAALRTATSKGADLCIFPEMATCGCYPMDELLRTRFVSDNLELLDRVASETRNIGVVIGYIRQSPKGDGLENAAALIADGEIISTHVKTRLSRHGDVEETKYFVPGESVTPVDFGGIRFGITLCNDICTDSASHAADCPRIDPVAEAVKKGAEVILNLASTPYYRGSSQARRQALVNCAVAHHRPLVHVNMVGGNEEWVFEGGSMAIDSDGAPIVEAETFKEAVVLADIESRAGISEPLLREETSELLSALISGTRNFFEKTNKSRPVVPLDGSRISNVAAFVTARAVGPRKMSAISLFSAESASNLIEAAKDLAAGLGIAYRNHDPYRWLRNIRDEASTLADRRVIHSTERTTPIEPFALRSLTRLVALLDNEVLIATETQTELAMFAPPPIVGDFAPFKYVSQSTLTALADHLEKEGSLPRVSSDDREDLRPTTGETFPVSPVPNAAVDALLEHYRNHDDVRNILSSSELDPAVADQLIRRFQKTEPHLRRLPPGIRTYR